MTGHVVDGRDPGQLAETLSALLSDPVRARRMGEAGRSWVAEHWRWDTMARRLSTLLDGDPVAAVR